MEAIENSDMTLTMKEKLSYAGGQLPGAFYGSFMGQIQAFYYAWMYLNFTWIIIAQIIYGIWNLINDPIFGSKIDKTRTKQGRYIPWIKKCALPFTIAFMMVFLIPENWRTSTDDMWASTQIYMFIWYLLTQIIYDTFFTIVYISHVALLPQMTTNMNERTQISIISAILGLIGVGLGTIPLSLVTDPTTEKIQIFKILVIVFAVVSLIPWIFIVKFVKEKQEYIPEQSLSFFESIKCVFKNPSGRIYMIYDGVSVGVLNFVMTAISFILAWVFGLNSDYQTSHPEWGFGSLVPYLIPIVICAIIGLFIELYIPKRWDIKTALMYSMITEAVGFFIAFLGCLPNPNILPSEYVLPNLWIVSIGLSIAMLGFTGDFIYHNPMRGDTIDYDEVLTGERREAVYAGVGCLISKPMISVALAVVPSVIAAYGLTSPKPGYSGETSLMANFGYNQAILGIAIAGFLCPAILALIGAIFWKWYPLNREKVEEVQLKLQEMHSLKRDKRLSQDGTSKFVE